MRNLLFVLFFSFISLTFSQQLVRNGDFSQGSPEFGSVPPEWTVSPADSGGWRYVNSDGFMGEEDANANSVQFTVEENVGVLRQEITLQAQTEYVLAAALKANGAVPRIELVSPEGRTVTSLQGSADRHGIWRQAQVQFSSRHNTKLEIRLVGSVTAAKAGAQSGIDQISLLPADIAAAAKPAALTVKPFVAPGENIALHKPYTMRPAPSYGPSNDPDDKIQLTDGKYTQGYFWVQKSTVGWNRAFPVVITIDLGREEPIAGMSWNTAAGAAGVTWPTSLQIYVSSDEKTWYYQGDLVALGTRDAVPPSDKYGVFRYATDSLQTKGRYVQLIYSQTQYSFCDEIEIYRGQDAWLAQAAGEEAVASPMEAFRNKGMLSSINLRLQTDLLAAEENLTNLPANTPGRQAALAKIPALKAAVQKISAVDSATFQTILPLTPEHEAALALNAISLRAAGFQQPFLWQNNRWDNLSMTTLPPTGAQVDALEVVMMSNEVRGETVNLTNPTDTALEYVFRMTGLPAQAALELREVINTDTKQNEPIAAALQATEEADGSLKLRVPAGCTKQIWLSFRRPELKDGNYQGRLTATTAGQPTLTVPVALRIMGRFPARPTIHVGGWDYLNGKASRYHTPDNLEANLAIIRDLYADTPWGLPTVAPQGAAFDDAGNLLNADTLNFRNWDEWVERWHDARQYCVFMSVKGPFQGEPMGTPRFQRMVGDYMTAWAAHLTKTGLEPRQLVLLLVDEPRNNEQDRIIIAWGKAIKAANTGIRLFEDPLYGNPKDGLPEMYSISDILCPNTPMMVAKGQEFTDFYLEQQADGRELWLYSCSGPAKQLDPITYHRAQMWRAFAIGAKGTFYWAFGCGGGQGNSWNAYTQPGVEYSPYFVSKTSVMEGKHSEAIREGVQDYEYLLMLQQKIQEKKQAGQTGPELEQAEKLLAEAPDRALANVRPGTTYWRSAKDRNLMDQVRVEVLGALDKLK